MASFAIIIILAYVGHYLIGRATLTKWLWSRYPKWLDEWATCPACSGTWMGALAAVWLRRDVFDFPGSDPTTWLIMALVCCFTTPLLAYVHLYALSATTGSAGDQD